MKKSPAKDSRRFDKHLFEAGRQCCKRLYLDFHAPAAEAPSDSRRAMSETGRLLLQLARSAFARGVDVSGATVAEAAAATAEKLAGEGMAVLFGAAFVAEGCEVSTDILVRQKDGQLDIFEVKSGTKVKARYLADLALQVLTIERAGFTVRSMFVLHLDRNYKHAGGPDYPPSGLLRSADVTERVRRLLPRVTREVRTFTQQLTDDSALQLPTGSFCTQPFPCPHLPNCSASEPQFPLRDLPDLTRTLEDQLHGEGIADLLQLDPARTGFTFQQRRALQAVQTRQLIVEPFVKEELLQVEMPLHFLAIANITEALPRFENQKPWQPVPHAWAVETLHADGRVERLAFAHADKGDPRAPFISGLGKHLETGGMIVCWCSDSLASVRLLLDGVPAEKPAIRAVLSRPHLDLRRLLESGLFHPELLARRDLAAMAKTLLGSREHADLAIRDDEAAFAALQKAATPRVRSATKEKIAADLRAWVEWHARTLLALYRRLSGNDTAAAAPVEAERGPRRKQLPPT